MNFIVNEMNAEDWEQVASVYREGIATGDATFETHVSEYEAWDNSHHQHCRLVARTGDKIIGWAALSPVSPRCAYSGVAELSIYVTVSARGRGVGKALLGAIIDESESRGIWILQGGILPENAASLALVRACGFRQVGRTERIGQMDGIWRDVILMERRSKVVGIEK